ncbi:hypothetical protein EBT16_12375, partial [bacterium]|nr:hypothetical protein [bacterium]
VFRRSYDRIYIESGQFEYKPLKNTEKCNLGNIFQDEILKTLGLENRKKGRDTIIANTEVDVKWTSSSSDLRPTAWRIPPECFHSICLLASSSDYFASWNLGIIRCDPKILKGENRDKKKYFNPLGKKSIIWIAENQKMPENRFLGLAYPSCRCSAA